jgi:hypothetical protein
VCFCETREDAEQVQKILVEWLKERGLTLSEEKTRIVHLTEGFDFLGFNIRHYPAPQTSRTGWKLLIKPSKESVQEVREKIKKLWDKAQGSNAQAVLSKLNPSFGDGPTTFVLLLPKRSLAVWIGGCFTKQTGTPDAAIRGSPKTGDSAPTGGGFILIGLIPGCLVTNKQGAICSSLAGSQLSAIPWSKEDHRQMIHI